VLQGTSLGARPKAVLVCGIGSSLPSSRRALIHIVVRASLWPWNLRNVRLDVAPVEITLRWEKTTARRAFDRPPTGQGEHVSALTILGLTRSGRLVSYLSDLADQIRARFADPERYLRELFSRITFNVLVSNTDDHARTTPLSGRATLTLTPL